MWTDQATGRRYDVVDRGPQVLIYPMFDSAEIDGQAKGAGGLYRGAALWELGRTPSGAISGHRAQWLQRASERCRQIDPASLTCEGRALVLDTQRATSCMAGVAANAEMRVTLRP